MNQGFTLWLTGLTASGKTTLARLVEEKLLERGLLAEVLDGGEMRSLISPDLGFSTQDRELHLKRLTYISALLNRNGVNSIVAAVSPLRAMRATVRSQLPLFLEVYLNCPLEVCRARSVGDFYTFAEQGEIREVAGINFPYEPPEKPEVEVFPDRETPEESAGRVIRTLELLELIPAVSADGYSAEDEEIIKRRLTDLGYL